MSFWGEQEWLDYQRDLPEKIVSDFRNDRLKDGCYRLTVGREAVFTIGPQDTDKPRRKYDCGEDFQILPGQFTYLITQEEVSLPPNAIGLINIATTEKVKGLVNVSGFHVDPSYSGRLIFTVFNAGATPVTLRTGQALFRLWLLDYRGNASVQKPGYENIPSEYTDRVIGAYPSPFALASKVSALENEVAGLRKARFYSWMILVVFTLLITPFLAAFSANFASHYLINTAIPAIVSIRDAWRQQMSTEAAQSIEDAATGTISDD